MAIDQTPQLKPSSKQHSPRRQRLGSAAGLLFVGLLKGFVLGVVWAFLRPGYTGNIINGVFTADPVGQPSNIEFTSFIWCVLLSGVIGVGVAIVAYVSAGRVEGLATLLWVGLVATAGALALVVVGNWVTYVLHPIPEAGTEEMVTLVPPIVPRIGWVAAPLMATLTYWIFAVISLPEEFRPEISGKIA
ncbi:hypothetical protein [Corynebacterium cystitidis]|uniref:hypothetical protein n=1 Tax=Corynebacterium cystitidis TaxID=35757 RepID=UPI00211DCD0E|nr:hypothetical protein [Corynebacterium cystitidis]